MHKSMKGFIIASPWIDLILQGKKVWELRSRQCRYRGEVGLIKKGTGKVWGTARFVTSSGPLDEEMILASFSRHLVPEEVWRARANWRFAWELADVSALQIPVAYHHRFGAQNWVNLEPKVVQQIRIQQDVPKVPAVMKQGEPVLGNLASGNGDAGANSAYRKIIVIEKPGGIGNGYLLLGKLMEWFPQDAIGGSNRSQSANKPLILHWGGPAPTLTDIDGSKKFFRDRHWFPAFVDLHQLKVGDAVQISRVDDYQYVISPIKASASTLQGS